MGSDHRRIPNLVHEGKPLAVAPPARRDPAGPDFPHGTLYGYRLGCRRDTYTCPADPGCPDVWSRHCKRGKARAAGAVAPGPTSYTPAGPALDHLHRLRSAGVTSAAVARAAGLPPSTVVDLQRRDPDHMWRATADALLTVTRADVTAATAYVPSARSIQLCRSMQAQGWSLQWQTRRLGLPGTWPSFLRTDTVHCGTADAVAALAADLEGRWGPAKNAATKARRDGWHPLACYDQHGRLLTWAVRRAEHDRRADPEATARGVLETLRLTLPPHSLSAADIAARLGITKRTVDRRRTHAGLNTRWNPDMDRVDILPGCAARAAAARAALRDYTSGLASADQALARIHTPSEAA